MTRDALAEPQVRIDSYLDGACLATMAEDVRDGLRRRLKELPPKYFYDARGSELFERITGLPEYYPTRAERAILGERALEIVDRTGAGELVELGSGTASKTRTLLDAMSGAGTLRRYVPFDCARSTLEQCASELVAAYPGLQVHGVVGDFEYHLAHVPPPSGARVVAFLGGTIGNLYPADRLAFLSGIRDLLGARGHLLLGVDLVKDRGVLEAAYNDSQGVTAEFNRNVLHAINRDLHADFVPEAFEHVAFFDEAESWIEMRLRAGEAQHVCVDDAGVEVDFAPGEEMRTEISAKFTPDSVERELAAAGLAMEALFTDPDAQFALTLAAPR